MDYKEHYRIDAEEFDYWGANQFSANETRRNQAIFQLAKIKPGQKVLDIGSGRGWLSQYAAAQGAQVTALDLSETNLKRIRQQDSRIHTVLGDACEIPIKDTKFDLIVALEVLEHIPQPEVAIAHWKSLLAPRGRLLICVPDQETIYYMLCIHCNQKTPMNAHLHSFDAKKLTALLISAGFRISLVRRFSHKLLIFLRINQLLKWLPYPLWAKIDKLCGLFADKYQFLAVVCR
jgi:2-polyprenyl-3-methyl-5-hydroxy-6-metoxy-1,4-benzoquinol methylase